MVQPSRATSKSKVERTYEFFAQVEREQRSIALNHITSATGYTVGTARTYILKKWRRFLMPTATAGMYEVKGVQEQTLQEFIALLQKRPLSPLHRKLVLNLPHDLAEWLHKQAAQKGCHVDNIILDILEQHRRAL